MVKCPYCGSTAQVKTAPTAEISKNKKWLVLSDNQAYLTLGAECGCGCQFTLDYYVPEPMWVNIETIEKR